MIKATIFRSQTIVIPLRYSGRKRLVPFREYKYKAVGHKHMANNVLNLAGLNWYTTLSLYKTFLAKQSGKGYAGKDIASVVKEMSSVESEAEAFNTLSKKIDPDRKRWWQKWKH